MEEYANLYTDDGRWPKLDKGSRRFTGRQLENRPHGRSLLGRRDRRTRGRPKVSGNAARRRVQGDAEIEFMARLLASV